MSYPLSSGGMTSNWYHGVKYDVPRFIAADATGAGNASYTLIHELTHYYFEADNEKREPHSVDLYLAYAEVLKGMGSQQDSWNGLRAYDYMVLSRFGAAPLISYHAAKEMNYGNWQNG